jgi:hypothetical protein
MVERMCIWVVVAKMNGLCECVDVRMARIW